MDPGEFFSGQPWSASCHVRRLMLMASKTTTHPCRWDRTSRESREVDVWLSRARLQYERGYAKKCSTGDLEHDPLRFQKNGFAGIFRRSGTQSTADAAWCPSSFTLLKKHGKKKKKKTQRLLSRWDQIIIKRRVCVQKCGCERTASTETACTTCNISDIILPPLLLREPKKQIPIEPRVNSHS